MCILLCINHKHIIVLFNQKRFKYIICDIYCKNIFIERERERERVQKN